METTVGVNGNAADRTIEQNPVKAYRGGMQGSTNRRQLGRQIHEKMVRTQCSAN